MRRLWGCALLATGLLACGPQDEVTDEVDSQSPALKGAVTESFDASYTNAYYGTCPQGFDVLSSANITGTQTTYFDEAGNPTSLTIRVKAEGTLTNASTGTTLRDGPDPQLITIDLTTGETTVVGLHYRVTSPKYGILVAEAGKLVISGEGELTHQAGLSYFDVDKLCAALQ